MTRPVEKLTRIRVYSVNPWIGRPVKHDVYIDSDVDPSFEIPLKLRLGLAEKGLVLDVEVRGGPVGTDTTT